jgi:hypothetical protein
MYDTGVSDHVCETKSIGKEKHIHEWKKKETNAVGTEIDGLE